MPASRRRAISLLGIELRGAILAVHNRAAGSTLELRWPAVRTRIAGKETAFSRPAGPPVATSRSVSQTFAEGPLRATVTVERAGPTWLRKRVTISTEEELRTPDWLEVERQILPADNLARRGYRATIDGAPERGQEEGAGVQVGCGYPLVGDRFFLGLEHPAGFAEVGHAPAGEPAGAHLVALRHHPVWRGRELGSMDAVFGWCEHAESGFAAYLDTVRIPPLRAPLVSFCTFWTDPYAGDLEYETSRAAYAAWFRGFAALGLVPDVFTLDAGWFDRRSLLRTKRSVGGDAGLKALERLARSLGSDLGLWVSSNGPIAMHPDYLRSRGFQVGAGNSSAYSGQGYGVMMDERFASAVRRRWAELVRDVGAVHLKIDWDNECATNDSFAAIYPTRDHVRQASLEAMFSIAGAARAENRRLVTRHGTYSSPWWLLHGNHLFLSDSGDSEFAALPSRTQRDAATTHRDLMYYNHLRRDRSMIPLDCIDNHEFPNAPRNPFPEDPVTWTNAVWHSFLRGSTYLAYTFCPEGLEEWQARSLAAVARFCRLHARRIFTPRGRMILGHPGRGEAYGFLHEGTDESWCVLRNPLPVPQRVAFAPERECGHPVRHALQIYPSFLSLGPEEGIVMLAHEVRVLVLSSRAARGSERFDLPCRIERRGSRFAWSRPSTTPEGGRSALVHELHRVGPLACLSHGAEPLPGGGARQRWFLQVPARMREAELQLRLRAPGPSWSAPRASFSRYEQGPGAAGLPVTLMRPGAPGYGERKNPDSTCASDLACAAVRLPSGGRFSLVLEPGGNGPPPLIEQAWVAGFEAPAREARLRDRGPTRFGRLLPPPHPLGFGAALELDIDEP